MRQVDAYWVLVALMVLQTIMLTIDLVIVGQTHYTRSRVRAYRPN